MNYLAIFSFVRALFKYEIVFDPTKWKNRQQMAEALGALLVLLIAIFPQLRIVEADALLIGGFVALVLDWVGTMITSRKVGFKPDGKLKKVYEVAKKHTPHLDVDMPIDDGVQFSDQAQSNHPRMPRSAEPNSVNSGGKGLRGGQQ